MEKSLRDDLTNKLLNQMTVVMMTNDEVQFRRAEVMANIIGRIVDLENLIETNEIKKQIGIPTKEIESLNFDFPKADFKPEVKQQEQKKEPEVRQKSLRQRILDLIKTNDEPLTSNEISIKLGHTNMQGLNVQLSMMKDDLVKFDRKDGFSKSQFSYGLKEWTHRVSFKFSMYGGREKKVLKLSSIDKTHNNPKHAINEVKIPASKRISMAGFKIGDEVDFLDVLRNKHIGIVVYLAESGETTGKRVVANGPIVTVKQTTPGEGQDLLYDRPLNLVKKRKA